MKNTLQKIYEKLQTREGITLIASITLIVITLGMIFGNHGHRAPDRAMNPTGQVPMIRVAGIGEINATPDIAQFTFSVSKDAATIADARNQVSEIGNTLLDKLKNAGIDEKDIKTENISTYPKYENRAVAAMACAANMPCPPSYNPTNPVIVGYTVSTSYSVKVRNLESVSKIATLLTDAKIFSLDGPNFMIDDEKGLQNKAREAAIADAKAQARILADQLGVRLGKITDFQVDGSGGSPVPMYARAMDASVELQKSIAPELPTGETKIISNVTITYSIR